MNQTLITAALSIIILSITTYINIKIKFAKDEKEAFNHIYGFASNFLLMFFVAWCSYSLYLELTSNFPITRKSILIIVVNVLAIYQLTLINIQFSITINLFGKTINNIGRILSIVEKFSYFEPPTTSDRLVAEDTESEPK